MVHGNDGLFLLGITIAVNMSMPFALFIAAVSACLKPVHDGWEEYDDSISVFCVSIVVMQQVILECCHRIWAQLISLPSLAITFDINLYQIQTVTAVFCACY